MRILTLCSAMFLLLAGHAQQVLYTEDFEGPTSTFSLNTTDVGSLASGANTWLMNDVFAGGEGVADCIGLEIPFSIPPTAGQPAGVPSANGTYLHTASTVAVANGILNCSFGAADGFCTDPGNHFARMSTDISTVGQGEVTLSFWWICQGGTANYGEVYYSTNGGAAWTPVTTPISQYRNQSSWVQQSVSLPAFTGQSTLRFGFRFVNGSSLFGASDPGFGIDAIRVTSENAVPNVVNTGTLGTTTYCAGSSLSVPFTSEGVFMPGNAFNVELSDATGSFAVPTVIGSLVSTGSGSVPCTLPMGSAGGTGYRVRVVSSTPPVIGSTSADLTIVQPSNAGADGQATLCSGSGPVQLIGLLGGDPDACGVWLSPSAAVISGVFDPAVDPAGVYTYVTDCAAPCPADMATVTVTLGSGPGAGADVFASVCSNSQGFTPYDYINGGATNGQFLYQGVPFPLPDFSVAGNYTLAYVVQSGGSCPNDTADFTFAVLAPPEAGASLTYTLCANAAPLDLLPLLVGAEQGGSWTDPSGVPFSGTFDPIGHPSGLYTYTVEGDAPCADDQAFVAIVVDPCSGIDEAGNLDLTYLGSSQGLHRFGLEATASIELVQVTDLQGRSIPMEHRFRNGDVLELDLRDRADGVYLITIRAGGRQATLRVLDTAR